MKKTLPKMMSDEDAEKLLLEDLTQYLTLENFKKNFTPISFEFISENAPISLQFCSEPMQSILNEISAK